MNVRKIITDFEKKASNLSQTARGMLEQVVALAPDGTDEEIANYLASNVSSIIDSCVGTSTAMGQSLYNTFREQLVGEAIDIDDISMASDYTELVKNMYLQNQGGDVTKFAEKTGQYIDTTIKHSIADSMFKASYKDKGVRFARVPVGIHTCDFCMMLASRGFVYVDKNSAGQFNKFHAFCDCNIVPSWEHGKPIQIDGYNPDELYQEYKQGKFGFTSNGKDTKKAVKSAYKSVAMPKVDNPIKVEFEDAKLPDKCYSGKWNQAEDMKTFLENVFEADDCVGTCSTFYDSNGRIVPGKGLFQRTQKQIVGVLDKTNNVANAVGRYKKDLGAYVRINALDGQGITDANVKRFAYTLIESDVGTMESQYGKIKALNLPTQAVVTSGNKSVHALVKIDASNLDEYRERVARLHAELKASGFDIDTTTKNPSRYMRVPGVVRGDGRQALVSINEGAKSYTDWLKWADEHRAKKDT